MDLWNDCIIKIFIHFGQLYCTDSNEITFILQNVLNTSRLSTEFIS